VLQDSALPPARARPVKVKWKPMNIEHFYEPGQAAAICRNGAEFWTGT